MNLTFEIKGFDIHSTFHFGINKFRTKINGVFKTVYIEYKNHGRSEILLL